MDTQEIQENTQINQQPKKKGATEKQKAKLRELAIKRKETYALGKKYEEEMKIKKFNPEKKEDSQSEPENKTEILNDTIVDPPRKLHAKPNTQLLTYVAIAAAISAAAYVAISYTNKPQKASKGQNIQRVSRPLDPPNNISYDFGKY